MSQSYVGEIRMFGGNFAPNGWMFCHGQILPISENETLFQLIGTTYGGDGQSTFALPDLRGRVPVHQGSGWVLAQTMGSETVTLTVQQIPAHSHVHRASTLRASAAYGPGAAVAETFNTNLYGQTPQVAMAGTAIGSTGGSQPHENMAPFLGVNFIISLFGIFPSPT